MFRKILAGLALLFFVVRVAVAAVDINTASAEELDKLKGVGPVKAKAIVDYRAKNGSFKKIEDIKNVPGIGDSTFEAIKKDLTIGVGSGLRTSKSGDTSRRVEKGAAAEAPAMAKGDAKGAPTSKSDAKSDRPTEKK